ncbi:probable splicing factor 3A subunit 1 [Selaginella moellendorffii]|uniref:probable splicing factor 3A subunit 1 n=1 Tax=Selaginella moellendorffii TaxID=88036 RepID=UPI000D1CD7CA|nr:probable splicing factor 3A subunit 1 [Selaginella moellendorffii]|eukprot:XP_002971215.2 probable splicing factor 3A subunit 1 [Selaginella moellendorffii]
MEPRKPLYVYKPFSGLGFFAIGFPNGGSVDRFEITARNGVDFERKITADNQILKFSFLKPSDPYHAYYQHKVSEAKSSGAPSSITAAVQAQSKPPPLEDHPSSRKFHTLLQDLQSTEPSKVVELQEPEPEEFLLDFPEGLSAKDVDIIKLTAIFAARHGSEFLTGLASREHYNLQFSFLKPESSLHKIFTGLCHSYSKLLEAPTALIDKLKRELDKSVILERCLHRAEWEKSQKELRDKGEEDDERMNSIDWHEFVVVETIQFVDEEDAALPSPMTQMDVIRRKEVMDITLLEDHFPDERRANAEEFFQVIVPAGEEPPMTIVRNWKRPEEMIETGDKYAHTKTVISPITSELIPVSKMEEHMRISLIHPKFKEEKERMMSKRRNLGTLASNEEIARNVMSLAPARPDLFGTTEEEVANAVMSVKKKEEPPSPLSLEPELKRMKVW